MKLCFFLVQILNSNNSFQKMCNGAIILSCSHCIENRWLWRGKKLIFLYINTIFHFWYWKSFVYTCIRIVFLWNRISKLYPRDLYRFILKLNLLHINSLTWHQLILFAHMWINEDLMKVNKMLFLNDRFVCRLWIDAWMDVGSKVDNGEV